MKKRYSLLLVIFYYFAAFCSLLLPISALVASSTIGPKIFALLFLPITGYFLFQVGKPLSRRMLRQPPILDPSPKTGFGAVIRKIHLHYNFTLVSLIIIIGFLSATNITQHIATLVFSPLLLYFAFRILPQKKKGALPATQEPVIEGVPEIVEPLIPEEEVVSLHEQHVDVDRRMFLKLIGSVGASVFLFALFTKKAEAAFFGSVPGPGVVSLKDSLGNKIDPAIKLPTDGYKIAQLDDSVPAYYGFVDKTSAWYIMREDSTGAYRFVKGAASFSSNWANRTALTYDYFSVIFA